MKHFRICSICHSRPWHRLILSIPSERTQSVISTCGGHLIFSAKCILLLILLIFIYYCAQAAQAPPFGLARKDAKRHIRLRRASDIFSKMYFIINSSNFHLLLRSGRAGPSFRSCPKGGKGRAGGFSTPDGLVRKNPPAPSGLPSSLSNVLKRCGFHGTFPNGSLIFSICPR